MIVATIVIALLLVAAGATAWNRGRPTAMGARELLDARLASGEISTDEHQQRRQVLTEQPPRRSPTATLALAVAAGGFILLAAGLWSVLAGAGAGWWTSHPHHLADHMRADRTATAPSEPAAPGEPELVIDAGELWFAPDRIELEAGSTTNLVLDNTGQIFHDLSIPALGVVLEARPGESASTALRSPAEGRYEFLCTVPGHAAGGMRGELVVTAAP